MSSLQTGVGQGVLLGMENSMKKPKNNIQEWEKTYPMIYLLLNVHELEHLDGSVG